MDKLDSLKINILTWYPFKDNSKILYLTTSDNEDIWSEYLSNISQQITIVKYNNEDSVKVNNVDNKTFIEGKFDKVKIDDQYDYVILLGTLEYANEIFDGKNAAVKLLEFSKSKLNDNGKILLAFDNRLGVNYLVGRKSKHCEKIFDSTKNIFNNGRLYSLSEITNILNECNFKYKRFYYPLPNYRYTNVIFTDKRLPERNDSKINYNVLYEEGSLVLQDECNLLKQFVIEGDFTKYTNSYFIELSEIEEDNHINYVSFNNMRKDEYSLVLKIYDDKVEKTVKEQVSTNHLRNIKEYTRKMIDYGFKVAEKIDDNDIITSELIKYPLLDTYIVSLIRKKNIEETYNVIDNWYNTIKQNLKPNEEGIIKDGFIDLVFENTFYNEEEKQFIIFDQEWYREDIPVDYILYRAIENLYAHNKSLNNYLPKEEMKKRYNIIESEDYIKLEQSLQEEVIDQERRKMYGKQYDYMISAEEVKNIIRDTKAIYEDNVRMYKLVDEVNKKIEELREDNKRLIKGDKKIDKDLKEKYKTNIFDSIKSKLKR
ncbi:MAG: hypothetical protein J6M60_04505 [Clostridia bacterium]|nr:hypothetical protein [Clostridia bacterium]